MPSPLATLIDAAVLAPSGDNLQPWRFRTDAAAHRLVMEVEPARDPSPMNAGLRMARIALGAALENVVRTADANGWPLTVDPHDDENSLQVRVAVATSTFPGEVPPLLRERCTQRALYEKTIVSGEQIDCLGTLALPCRGTALRVIPRVDAAGEKLRGLARWIGAADQLMFSQPAVRRAFISSVRFDVPPAAEVDYGLSRASLGVSALEANALPWLARMPHWLVRLLGVPRSMNRHAQKLVASASGVVAVLHEREDAAADFDVGRALQSVWLELTALDFAVQPMMSLPVLECLRRFAGDILNPRDAQRAREIYANVQELLDAGDMRIGALLRFGVCHQPAPRVRRLPGLTSEMTW